MNILITSIGRRAYLIKFFREALDSEDKLFVADCDPYAPALELGDKAFIIPRAFDEGYTGALLELCKDRHVDAVIPINDLELPILARNKALFAEEGIKVLVSDPEVIDICTDKYRTYEFLIWNGFRAPKTYIKLNDALQDFRAGAISFPLMVKLRKGSAGQGLVQVEDMEELRQEWELKRRGEDIISEYVGSEHYGLDIFSDCSGKPIAVFGVKVLYRKRGETYQAVSILDGKLIRTGVELANKIKLCGPWDVDLMATQEGYSILEVNPRLGGCYPVSHFAGADFPRKIISLIKGEALQNEIGDYKDGVVMLKQYTALKGITEGMERKFTRYVG